MTYVLNMWNTYVLTLWPSHPYLYSFFFFRRSSNLSPYIVLLPRRSLPPWVYPLRAFFMGLMWHLQHLPLHVLFLFFLYTHTSYYLYTIYYFCFTQRCLDEFCLKCFRNTGCQSLLAINSHLAKFFKSFC